MVTAAASLGARLFLPESLSTHVGWTIRKGYDFPDQTLRQLETWGMILSVIPEDSCPSTRGQLKYLDSTFASNASAPMRLECWRPDHAFTIQPRLSNISLQL